jgi:hypothetical protein
MVVRGHCHIILRQVAPILSVEIHIPSEDGQVPANRPKTRSLRRRGSRVNFERRSLSARKPNLNSGPNSVYDHCMQQFHCARSVPILKLSLADSFEYRCASFQTAK